jgi:membrane-bound serine protease (ClpP class)
LAHDGFTMRGIPLLVACLLLSALPARTAPVVRVPIRGPIQEIQEEILVDAVGVAREAGAGLLVVELDTPGGLESSMRAMVQAILASPVPVAVLVAPSGARAASAGFFLLLCGDLAAMADGTNAGAAHPVLAVGGLFPVKAEDVDATMMEKATNDSIAFLRGFSAQRGRNPDEAVRAITENRTWTAEEALEADLIDLKAADAADLARRVDGRTLTRLDGSLSVLSLHPDQLITAEPSLRQALLLFLSNPVLALLLALAGLALLYLEFTHPGLVAPGVAGALCVILSLIGFSFLPINFVGVLLIVGGLGLLVAEVFMAGFGVLGLAGAVALVFGSVILVKAPIPEMRIPLTGILLLVVPFAVLVVALGRLALKAHRNPTPTGQEGLVGQVAVAREPLAPEGTVLVEGEIWKAVLEGAPQAAAGDKVRVVRVQGLLLFVNKA